MNEWMWVVFVYIKRHPTHLFIAPLSLIHSIVNYIYFSANKWDLDSIKYRIIDHSCVFANYRMISHINVSLIKWKKDSINRCKFKLNCLKVCNSMFIVSIENSHLKLNFYVLQIITTSQIIYDIICLTLRFMSLVQLHFPS